MRRCVFCSKKTDAWAGKTIPLFVFGQFVALGGTYAAYGLTTNNLPSILAGGFFAVAGIFLAVSRLKK